MQSIVYYLIRMQVINNISSNSNVMFILSNEAHEFQETDLLTSEQSFVLVSFQSQKCISFCCCLFFWGGGLGGGALKSLGDIII